MIQYILECVAFQLVFLIIYDFFLKRETFFQWNRFYLLGTHVLSLFLPRIKIEAFITTVPVEYYAYPEYLWNSQIAPLELSIAESSGFNISWQEGILILGILAASTLFAYKIWQLYGLRKKGEIHYYTEFTQIIVANSNLAFSFFKSIFLGDKVINEDYESIIKHELVHIKQRHSWDLLFFELLRIVFWFNPLVYIYQSRISELHEFIADAQVAKTNKKEQYQLLLSQVFQTQHISFVNQFFKSSLIKKRIVMLQKSKSKRVWQIKYLLLLPLISGMLLYTSCEQEPKEVIIENEVSLTEKIAKLKAEIEAKDKLSEEEKEQLVKLIYATYPKDVNGISGEKGAISYVPNKDLASASTKYNQLLMERQRLLKNSNENNPIIENLDQQLKGLKRSIIENNDGSVPFAVIDEVPVFPGCEDATDKRTCFQEMMQKHISKNFHYPEVAQELGIQGRVNVMFTINSNGEIENIKKRGPHKLLEEEVHRIISRLPKMKPGKQLGQTVNVPFSIPISFKLQ